MLFAERSPLRRARCKVSDQIYKVLSLHQARLESAHITVQTDFAEVPEIWADSNQLQEALFHLVQNAEQAMSAARGAGTLVIRVRPSGDGVRIEVADDGPGVAPDDLARVFNPFFTTKAPGEGRGLGLSVAHSVVAEHEGRLWAENRPGGGAMFVIELPGGVPAADPALAPSA
jgi:C4-dicarboxylate-specific signal transduction histidine kinase